MELDCSKLSLQVTGPDIMQDQRIAANNDSIDR